MFVFFVFFVVVFFHPGFFFAAFNVVTSNLRANKTRNVY